MPSNSYIDDPTDIKLNTHTEVDQILGRPPGWILRWGITAVFLTVIIFGVISWFLKYPDEIAAPVVITTENPVIKVIARASGKLDKLFVINNQTVTAGEILAILDNPASFEDIYLLSNFLDDIKKLQNSNQLSQIVLPSELELGNIQSQFAALSQKIQDYLYFSKNSNTPAKINSLDAQIKYKRQLNKNLEKLKTALALEITFAERDFLRNKDLNAKGIVSNIDFEKTEVAFLQQNRQLESMENQIVNNDISIEQLKTQILDLRQGRNDGHSTREFSINEESEGLKSQIKEWKQSYIITAPISGQVSFSNIWSEQQFVNANEEVLSIVPSEGAGKTIAKALLPVANSGKVEVGQRVNIHLDGFPFQEYGLIKATVMHISLTPFASSNLQNRESYLLDISLPDQLITTYNKKIPFRQEMQGTAKIITEDRRIIERIFDRVMSILKNR